MALHTRSEKEIFWHRAFKGINNVLRIKGMGSNKERMMGLSNRVISRLNRPHFILEQ